MGYNETTTKENQMSNTNTQFVVLATIGIANLAAGAYFAHKAKTLTETVQEEIADQKAKANEMKENLISNLQNITF